MAGIHDHRQMAQPLHRLYGRKIQGVPGISFKGPDAPFTEDDVLIAFRHNVFRAHEPFFDGSGQSPLQEDGFLQFSQFFQQGEVLHIPGPHLDQVHFFHKFIDLVRRHDLRHNGQMVGIPCLADHVQTFVAQPLEGVRRSTGFERPAPKHGCSALFHRGGNGVSFHRTGTGNDHQLFAAHFHPADVDDGIIRMEHPVGPFERFLDPHGLVHPFIHHEIFRIQYAGIPYDAQDFLVLPDAVMDGEASLFQALSQFFRRFLGCTFLHYDDHVVSSCSSFLPFYFYQRPLHKKSRLARSLLYGSMGTSGDPEHQSLFTVG